MDKWRIGNAIRWIGWAIVVVYGIKYSYYTFNTLSDPSVSAYAMFAVLQGALFVAGGVILIWIGRGVRGRKPEAAFKTE
jgi:hypothetical protein